MEQVGQSAINGLGSKEQWAGGGEMEGLIHLFRYENIEGCDRAVHGADDVEELRSVDGGRTCFGMDVSADCPGIFCSFLFGLFEGH